MVDDYLVHSSKVSVVGVCVFLQVGTLLPILLYIYLYYILLTYILHIIIIIYLYIIIWYLVIPTACQCHSINTYASLNFKTYFTEFLGDNLSFLSPPGRISVVDSNWLIFFIINCSVNLRMHKRWKISPQFLPDLKKSITLYRKALLSSSVFPILARAVEW